MQYCSVSVRLNGKPTHVVSGKVVSVPEIKILQAIHGDDAVTDIIPAHVEDISSEDERERLRKAYEPAQVEEQRNLVARVFGPMGNLPRTLAEIGLDPRAEARRLREKATALANAADRMDAAENAPEAPNAPEDVVTNEDEDFLGFDDTEADERKSN